MYKATSEGLQRAARSGAQAPAPKMVDRELLREAEELGTEYSALCEEKRRVTNSLSILNTKIEQYKYSALRNRSHVDNTTYRKLVAERRRLVDKILDLDSEIVRVRAPLKERRKAISQQKDFGYGRLFQQAAKIILAEELYLRVAELADTLEKATESQGPA